MEPRTSLGHALISGDPLAYSVLSEAVQKGPNKTCEHEWREYEEVRKARRRERERERDMEELNVWTKRRRKEHYCPSTAICATPDTSLFDELRQLQQASIAPTMIRVLPVPLISMNIPDPSSSSSSSSSSSTRLSPTFAGTSLPCGALACELPLFIPYRLPSLSSSPSVSSSCPPAPYRPLGKESSQQLKLSLGPNSEILNPMPNDHPQHTEQKVFSIKSLLQES